MLLFFRPPLNSNSAEVTTRCRRTASKTCSKVKSTTWRSRCCPEWTASRRGSPGCATRRSSAGEWSPPSRPFTRGSPTWRKVVFFEGGRGYTVGAKKEEEEEKRFWEGFCGGRDGWKDRGVIIRCSEGGKWKREKRKSPVWHYEILWPLQSS